jgi:hypothetical protein
MFCGPDRILFFSFQFRLWARFVAIEKSIHKIFLVLKADLRLCTINLAIESFETLKYLYY